MTKREKLILSIDKQVGKVAARHRAAVLGVIRGYYTALKRAAKTAPPQMLAANMERLMPVEPMQEAILQLWLDAAVTFRPLTQQMLEVVVSKHAPGPMEHKRTPQEILAEVLISDPDLYLLYRDVFAYFDSYGAAKVITIVESMRGEGREIIRHALEDILSLGLGEKEGAALLNRYIDDGWKTSLWRAERIVRTEVHGAWNTTSLDEARRSNLLLLKEWGALPDKRTRTSHVAADGQVQEMDKPFQVGDALLMTPGDPTVDAPEEIINCRCTVLYQRKYKLE